MMHPARTALALAVALSASACRSTPTVGSVRSSDGVEIVFTDRGRGAPPLVLVHGWACERAQWSEVDAELAREHRVVELDLGGHGDSGYERSVWNLESLSEDVVAVLDGLELEGAVLIGHSMGGPVSLAAARKRPQRVAGVIGVDTFHDAERKADPELMRGYIGAFRSDYQRTARRFVESAFQPNADPELVARVMAGLARVDPAIAVALVESFADYDLAAALRQTPVPVYAINAEANPTNIEGNRKFARWFDVRFVPGVGHWLMMEAPEAFVRCVDEFLADLAARKPAELRTG